TKASANAADGVSAVQTAEGALAEVHDMLQRMNELCVQAANGTNSESDRGYIQDEIEQLETEIDRIAQTTKFNEIYLLNGNGQTEVQTLEAHDAGLKGTLTEAGVGKSKFVADPLKVGDTVKIGDQEYKIADSDRADKFTSINSLYQTGNTPATGLKAGDKIIQDGVTYTVKLDPANPNTEYAPEANYAEDVIGNQGTATDIAKFVDDAGNEVALTIKEGATLVRAEDGKTTKLVGTKHIFLDKVDDATYGVQPDGPEADYNLAGQDGWKPGNKIVDEDGVEYTYVEVNGVLNNVTHTTAGFYKSEGNKAGDSAYAPKAGDKYTIKDANGNDVTDKISNGGVGTIETIKNAIKALEPGNSGSADAYIVVIQDSANDIPGKSYNISATTSGGLWTADDVANLVQAGNYVTIQKATIDTT
ncbi:MAG: flagellin, partial [Lachnospiraceae bacterium]|nr:flagellin [Lachnospiraceae bacterium]